MRPQMKYVECGRFLSQLPRKLSRIAALDVGTKHIGVALSDEGRLIAQPHSTIERGAGRNGSEAVSALARKIQTLVHAEQVDGLVVGAPMYQGKPTALCEEIVQLMLAIPCQAAAQTSNEELIFTLWNENSSTVEARRVSKALGARRASFERHKDELAAAVILNSFLAQKWSST